MTRTCDGASLMRLSCLPIVSLSLVLGWAMLASAAEPQWTRFRGPNGCGISETATIPATWTERDYRWRVELPGIGFSSPVLWEDRLYLTSTVEEQTTLFVLCLKTSDGSVLWKQPLKTKPHPSSRPTSTLAPPQPWTRIGFTWSGPRPTNTWPSPWTSDKEPCSGGATSAACGGRRLWGLAGPGGRRGRAGQRSGPGREKLGRGPRPEDGRDPLASGPGNEEGRLLDPLPLRAAGRTAPIDCH